MKKTLLAITAGLLFAGAAGGAAAQSYYYDDSDRYYEPDTVYYDSDVDRDGVADRYDRYDNRYDRGDSRYAGSSWQRDRDCDGIPDRRDYNDRSNYRDNDCDGVPNRFDRIDSRTYRATSRYAAPRYVAPYGYRYNSRYAVGTRLPSSYYGNSYYVDYRPYGLSAPPYGYRWVRVGSDVYLTSMRNGMIAEVIYSLFR
jgi:Ni/Co efflux regulator RcnB